MSAQALTKKAVSVCSLSLKFPSPCATACLCSASLGSAILHSQAHSSLSTSGLKESRCASWPWKRRLDSSLAECR